MEYVLVLPAQKEGNVIASEKKRRSNKREFHGGREVSLGSVENNFTVDGIIKSKRKKKVDDNKMQKSAKARNFLFKKKREPQGYIKEIINPYSHFYRSQLGFIENNLLVHEKIKTCEPQSDCMEIIDPENMNANDINACVNSKKLEKNLSASEKWNEAYKRVSPDCIWKPPRSETILIQEDHAHDPWRVLVICMLLNRTSGRQTREIVSDFFKLCPDAKSCTQVARKEIEETIKTLGFRHKRTKMVQRLSREYLDESWTHVTQLHGVGKYAADAYAIFVNGKWDRVKPADHMLNYYWDFLHRIYQA